MFLVIEYAALTIADNMEQVQLIFEFVFQGCGDTSSGFLPGTRIWYLRVLRTVAYEAQIMNLYSKTQTNQCILSYLLTLNFKGSDLC